MEVILISLQQLLGPPGSDERKDVTKGGQSASSLAVRVCWRVLYLPQTVSKTAREFWN
jgi:hypothetical protein